MTPQQEAELEFWREEFARYELPEQYVTVREVRDLGHYAELLPEIRAERGRGLDLACGLVSILGRLQCREVVAIDALLPDYARIYSPAPNGARYVHANGEDLAAAGFADGCFDFVWCVNAADHTPNPEKMLAEARRVLKPGGRFYFFVNFDPALYAPHYEVWNLRKVEERLGAFKLLRGAQVWSETWQKYVYSALYRRDA